MNIMVSRYAAPAFAALLIVLTAFIIAAMGMSRSTSVSKSPEFATVATGDFMMSLNEPGSVILDIRTPEEYSDGHIAGAQNVDFYAESFTELISRLDRNVPYKIYCNSGNRSAMAVELMKELGFTDVTELSGGIQAWARGGGTTCTNC
ncbi:MAG: Thiosulfate sulfurtransferase PspE precursor [candidate division WS6 bacterium OLB20]|uniref:Thiosulfate sulfurtransferase PspE n=1 Tax=candidate division WS6 bacterium OLB20 TaxID=1617426 RepID=A0A136LWL6_9BACT|nr:MAG: Thiosulfate sulfurtransferase PspE precursor [candidate division WS6 bacterium OLB20]